MSAEATWLYLIGYNSVQLGAWSTLFCGAMHQSTAASYTGAQRKLLLLAQCASIAETAHAAMKLVPSAPMPSLMQWMGRSLCMFVVEHTPAALRPHAWIRTLVLAWSAADIIRYALYVLQALEPKSPGPNTGLLETVRRRLLAVVLWLRYNAFLALYPLGVTAELMCWHAFVNHRFSQAWQRWTVRAVLAVVYQVGFGHLFRYMLHQRRVRGGRMVKQ